MDILQERDLNAGQKRPRHRKPKKNRKPYHELKHSTRTERKRQMETLFKDAAEKLVGDIKSVKVDLNFENGTVMSFFPRQERDSLQNGQLQPAKNDDEDLRTAQRVLAIKDKYRISDEALHELHMLGKIIPSKNKVQEEKKRLNTVIPIQAFQGVKTDCSSRRLQDVLSYFLQLPSNSHLLQGQELRLLLRFSCDGAKITKKLNSVRGVVKVLHPRGQLPETADKLSMSPEDELTLFFYMGEENRSTMLKFGNNTFSEMAGASENGLNVMGKTIHIDWVLTCDWKALALIKGINAANSDHFCLWCHCAKGQICDFSIPSWPIQRSVEEQRRTIDSGTGRLGYVEEDMCPFIQYSNMVPDDLHLRIRISLKLFNQVVTWALDQGSEGALEKELKRIGVSFHFWEERGDGKGSTSVKKWSQPSGDDLKAIVKHFKIHNVLENREDRHLVKVESLTTNQLKEELVKRGLPCKGKKADLVTRLKENIGNDAKIQKRQNRGRLQVSYDYESDEETEDLDVFSLQMLWSDFDELMEGLRRLPSSENYKSPTQLMELARQWAKNFRRYTFDEDVTPYIHVLVYHIPYFLGKYRYIHDIGVSQVERKNYDHRQAYFGSTNRNGGRHKRKISLQVLQRENRMLWAKHEATERTKRAYKKRMCEIDNL